MIDDPFKFIRLLKIQDKDSGKLVPFTPNDEQLELLDILQNHNLVIIVKPRQIGISTLLRAHALHKVYTSEDPLKFGVISFHKRSADNLRRMDKTMYEYLPDMLLRELDADNATTMRFDDSKAELSSFTAGSKGGTRSFMLTSAHLSEFAYYENQADFLAAIKSTVGKGQIIIESTAVKSGDEFHRLIMNAPENGWKVVTFWWWKHKKYRVQAPEDFTPTGDELDLIHKYHVDFDQLYWRRMEIGTMGLSRFRREYPSCLEDAFHLNMSTYMDLDKLSKIEPVTFKDDKRIYEKPRHDDVYAMGVDVAAGVGKDYSAITVVSMDTKQPVYHWRSNTISPSFFADEVLKIAQWYNDAMVLCESNNHGHLVLYRLKHFGYKNLWYTHEGKDWTTTVKSKLDAFETLREIIENEMIDKLDSIVLAELMGLVVKRVTPEASEGLNDDLAMSLALAYRCLRDIPARKLVLAKRKIMDILIEEARRNRRTKDKLPFKSNN